MLAELRLQFVVDLGQHFGLSVEVVFHALDRLAHGDLEIRIDGVVAIGRGIGFGDGVEQLAARMRGLLEEVAVLQRQAQHG